MKTPSIHSQWLLLLIGLAIGAYQFFHPVFPIAAYLTTPYRVALADNYWTLADSIFRPQTLPWAESILMPVLAKVLGASSDLLAFQFFNVFLTICIMPVFCLLLKKQLTSTKALVVGIVVFACTFRYLRDYVLGAPDPLTMILILLAVAAQNKLLVLYVFLAGLSHFSLALVAMFALIPLSVVSATYPKDIFRSTRHIIVGLVLSKLFLIGWNWVFEYHLFSRWDFLVDKGLSHFTAQFLDNPIQFFYTPGPVFGLTSLLAMSYMLLKKRYMVVLAYGFALAVTYGALFITLDGLRIFSVVIIGAYFNFIVLCLKQFFQPTKQVAQLAAASQSPATSP